MSVLEINNLSKSYGKIQALKNLSLTIEPGHVYGILGPNGSGKTTTLGIILGVLSHDSGSFAWFGKEPTANTRKRIGSILETPNFYPYLNASENLDIISDIKGVPKTDYSDLLKQVNLYERRKSKFRTYSLGMKQRLAIASTLIGDPDVLIFDEPTNGLDPEGIAEVRDILKNIADTGKTVLMASHILDEVEKICTHVAIIKKGNLLASGSVGQILSSDQSLDIAALDNEKLFKELESNSLIKTVVQEKTFIHCTVSDNLNVGELSQFLSENGHVLTHLVLRKKKLEEEFLEITRN